MRDVDQGRILFALSLLTMVVYFWAVFLSPRDVEFLGRTIDQWAVTIPAVILVYLFLIVVAWIGWAMATTPPPLPLKEKEELDEEEDEENREEKKNQRSRS